MITVLFSCDMCGLDESPVEVPTRHKATDIRLWMDIIINKVQKVHLTISPDCKATTIEKLKIPISDNQEFIGQEIK
jgi:hypothetical protein